jgi:hypothetical protein
VNSRNEVPTVDGAYTPPNSVFIPPLRTVPMPSVQSPRIYPRHGLR